MLANHLNRSLQCRKCQVVATALASQMLITSEQIMTMLCILEIMACCLQIIHLDLKSHNILLGRGGVAKIADVGLAKIMSKSATRASAAGTFDWAAPGIPPPPPPPLSAHASHVVY